MTKKQKWKYFFKFFGIGAAIAVGAIGLVCAYLGITGGFNPVVIEPTSISFALDNNYYQQDTGAVEPVFVVNDDFCLKVNPDPENATELDAKLKIEDGAKLIKNILVKKSAQELAQSEDEEIFKEAEKLDNVYYQITLGEEFKIVLSENQQDENERLINFYVESQSVSTYCRAKVLVDAKLESFELKFTKIGKGEKLFPTDEFYVGVDYDSLAPTSAMKKSALTELTNKSKTIEYTITEGQDIVSIVSTNEVDTNGLPQARLKINNGKSGKFTITAHICDLYENISNLEDYHNLYENNITEIHDEYYARTYGGTFFNGDESEEFEGFMIKSSLELESEPIEVENITAVESISGLHLFDTRRFSPSDLELKINPKNIEGSHYTSDSLSSYIDELNVQAGYFVNSQSEADLTVSYGDNEKYIKLSNNYISVKKEADINGEFVWVITIEDYTLDNCLVFSLDEYPTKIEDAQEVLEPIYCVVNVEVSKNEIPSYAIMIDEDAEELNSQSIELSYDVKAEQQTDFYDLTKAKLVLVNDANEPIKVSNKVQNFADSDSDYKTTLFVTKDSEGKWSYSNSVFKIENDKVVPVGTGRNYLYSIVVKTNKDGKVVDAENVVIENEYEILSRCVVLYYTTTVNVSIYQVLEIKVENTIELYKLETTLKKVEDEDKTYEIEKVNGEIKLVKMYKGTKLYLKLNVNDQDAYKYAVDMKELTFSCSKDLISLAGLVKEKIDGVDTYLLPITVMDTDEDAPVDTLTISYNQNGETITINLDIETRDYILQGIELSSNGVKSSDETVDSVLTLSLNSENANYYWTASSDLSENREFVLTSKLNPLQANIAGMVDYSIYEYPNFDIHSSKIDADLIDSLTSSTDVIELNGEIARDEDYNDVLKFNIKKAGRVVVIASYTRDDGVTIFSNAFVIETIYPYFELDEYNYGNNVLSGGDIVYQAKEEYEDETYRIITTTYDDQKTNLLDFYGREKSGQESIEGVKIKLKYKYSDSTEVAYSNLHAGLYNFEVVEILGSSKYVLEDFECVYENGYQYLITPRVSEKVYLKIRVSTKFGYNLSKTYNYVLQPDYLFEGNITLQVNKSEFAGNNKISLFNIKIENNEIVNDGGKLFITNNYIYSNYCDDNNDHLTGGGTIVKKIIYLSTDYDTTDLEEDLPDGYELKKILSIVTSSDEKSILSYNSNCEIYANDISQITSDYTVGYLIYCVIDEDEGIVETILNGQINITCDD